VSDNPNRFVAENPNQACLKTRKYVSKNPNHGALSVSKNPNCR